MPFGNLIKNFRPRFLWTVAIVWNVLFGCGIYASGGFGKPTTPTAAVFIAVAFLGTASTFAGLFISPAVRGFALREGALMSSVQGEVAFLCLLAGTMGVATVVGLFLQPT
jgi:hypothetical protein